MTQSAFIPFPILDRLPVKIECMEIWNSQLLLGTESGYLMRYEIIESQYHRENESPFKVNAVDSNRNFSKKPILQLTVVENKNYLFSISDDVIQVHELPTFKLLTQVPNTKKCHYFLVDNSLGGLTIFAAIKKKLKIFILEAGRFIEKREIAVPEPIRVMSIFEQNLYLALKTKYLLYNLGALQNPPRNIPVKYNPNITKLREKLLVITDRNRSSIVSPEWSPLYNWGIEWSDHPQEIGFYFPYVIGLLSKHVEVRTTFAESRNAVQIIPNRNVNFITIKNDTIYVANANFVWRLAPVPIGRQVEELIRANHLEDAITLLENFPAEGGDENAKQEKLRSIRFILANNLFWKGSENKIHYKEAIRLFLNLQINPFIVISLYRNFLPRDLETSQNYNSVQIQEQDQNLKNALEALVEYLLHFRKPPTEFDPEEPLNINDDYASSEKLQEIIDTSLLRAYVKMNDTASIATLLRSKNHCHLKEAENLLHNNIPELILLYESKGLHEKALQILSKTRQQGHHQTIQYLSKLGVKDFELVLKYAKTPLEEVPKSAINIFIADRAENDRLPPDKVVTFLGTLNANARQNLIIPYLEWVVMKGEKREDFHNQLVVEYFEKIRALSSARVDPQEAHGSMVQTRKRFQDHLLNSKYYNAEKLVHRITIDELYDERAIIFSRVGKHDKALDIFARKLNDHLRAEQYCQTHYDEHSEESRDVYLALLEVYLKPTGNSPVLLDPAITLLRKHYLRINPAKALQLLPDDINLTILYSYLECVLRCMAEKRRNNQVVSNLLKTEQLKVHEKYIKATSKSILINEDNRCPVCNRPISGEAAFACYPNGVVVHFACCEDKFVCPVTKKRFNVAPDV